MRNRNKQRELLTCLSDGKCHSGELLGESLGISRAAVWKQIKALSVLNIDVESVKGQGYQINNGLDLIDKVGVESFLTSEVADSIEIFDVLFSVDSTNDYVLKLLSQSEKRLAEAKGIVVVAEQQTAGRGRRGRQWFSPFAGSIYLTLGWQFSQGVAAIEGLSLVVGLKVLKAIQQEYGLENLQLKWPNDILYKGEKLAGVLIEMQGDPSDICSLAIGIGVNINLPKVKKNQIDQPWIDLATIVRAEKKELQSRNQFLAVLLNNLLPMIENFEQTGFKPYQQEWQLYDAYAGAEVCLHAGKELFIGRACGIDSSGAYGIETESGSQYFNGGEVTLRVSES